MFKPIIRLIAVLALLNGLADAARLLGMGAGDVSPLQTYGIAGFATLLSFTIARLFAAVGMWIYSNWGAPLLFGTTLAELIIFLLSIVKLDIGLLGFGVRLIELAGAILVLWLAYRTHREGLHD
ncbi:hypothetical protein MNBD_ALPHA12-208 [hydrothermal vent metagenome]|uniref:Uncharacterized protein n=1 Tax=hydrothermal vent metagenome TaxID=652676 RepID=A0A3B0U569_9ZZZZ